MALAMSHRKRLRRIEGFAAQQEHLAEAEDMRALAESARKRIMEYLEARRNGEPLPVLESSIDQNSPAREQFRQRLDEMGQQLRRYAELRAVYDGGMEIIPLLE
jgi:hypothetical protein